MSLAKKSDEFVYDSESGSDYEDSAFEPPKHFSKVSLPEASADLDNKEVWLIKTPKGFPVSELKTLPVSFTSTKVSNDGVKPFSVQSKSYQVNEEHFSAEAAKYALINQKVVCKKIDRFYTIREVVQIPEIDYSQAVKARQDVPKVPDLRMRHFATGYSAKDFPEAQPVVSKKRKLETEESAEKTEEDKTEKTEKKEKKEKKDKKEKREKKEKKEKKHKKEKKDKE